MTDRIRWKYYPPTMAAPPHILDVVSVFDDNRIFVNSVNNRKNSNEVLRSVSKGLVSIGYLVESGKKIDEKITVPVLFGENGTVEKCFDVDAYNENTHTVIEVEAGRAVSNNQFLKDLFEACMMYNIEYLVIAVRNEYSVYSNKKEIISKDFERVKGFMNSLYASNRVVLPLKGLLIIGY